MARSSILKYNQTLRELLLCRFIECTWLLGISYWERQCFLRRITYSTIRAICINITWGCSSWSFRCRRHGWWWWGGGGGRRRIRRRGGGGLINSARVRTRVGWSCFSAALEREQAKQTSQRPMIRAKFCFSGVRYRDFDFIIWWFAVACYWLLGWTPYEQKREICTY